MSTQPGYHAGRRLRHYPSRDAWVAYLERYVRHHAIAVRFHTTVERIERDDAAWLVRTSAGALRCRIVVVATGYNHAAKLPGCAGRESFSGELTHAARYRDAAPYRGRDVLVVGAGDTGTDIANSLVRGGAARVRVAMRTPPTILTRCRLGVPLNPAAIVLDQLPVAIGDRVARWSQRLTFGDLTAHGLPPAPRGALTTLRDRRVGPAIDDGFVDAVKRGDIEIVSALDAFDGADVVLADGARIRPDAVIAATGYDRGLEPLVGRLGVLDHRGEPRVTGGRAHPAAPDLYFVGDSVPFSGQLRGIRLDAKKMARAVARRRA